MLRRSLGGGMGMAEGGGGVRVAAARSQKAFMGSGVFDVLVITNAEEVVFLGWVRLFVCLFVSRITAKVM